MRDVLLGETQGSLDLLCSPEGVVNVTMPLPLAKAIASGLTLIKASNHFRPEGKSAQFLERGIKGLVLCDLSVCVIGLSRS